MLEKKTALPLSKMSVADVAIIASELYRQYAHYHETTFMEYVGKIELLWDSVSANILEGKWEDITLPEYASLGTLVYKLGTEKAILIAIEHAKKEDRKITSFISDKEKDYLTDPSAVIYNLEISDMKKAGQFSF